MEEKVHSLAEYWERSLSHSEVRQFCGDDNDWSNCIEHPFPYVTSETI